MGFDFENAEPWTVSTFTPLPLGPQLVKISEPETAISANGQPQLQVQLSDGKGASLRHRITYGDSGGYGVQKIVGLFQAAGVELTNADQTDDGRLTDEAAKRLDGKTVGCVVHDEPGYRDPSKTYRAVKGYVHPTQIDSDIPADVPVVPAASADDDIPF